jgi:hypothetical protein
VQSFIHKLKIRYEGFKKDVRKKKKSALKSKAKSPEMTHNSDFNRKTTAWLFLKQMEYEGQNISRVFVIKSSL